MGCTQSGFSFFFSSRRRHTRCLSDWSSDVCSSDLYACAMHTDNTALAESPGPAIDLDSLYAAPAERIQKAVRDRLSDFHERSEERRVGKECRSRGAPCQ